MKIPKNPKILIGRSDMLGDVVCSTPIIAPIKQLFPDAKLYYLIKESFIPLMDTHPDIQGCIADPLPYTTTRSDAPSMARLAQRIKKESMDIFIGLWEEPRYGWIAKKAGIPIRIGHAHSFKHWWYYTHTYRTDFLDFSRHIVDINLSLLKAFGFSESPLFPTRLCLSDVAKKNIHKKFPWTKNPYVVIHIDAGTETRILSVEIFSRVVHHLLSLHIPHVVLCGQARNSDSAKSIIAANNNDPRILDLTTSATLEDLTVIIDKAKFLFGSDSGPVHIASACNTPVVVYYQNRIQNPMRWGPWMVPHSIIWSEHGCRDKCDPTSCKKFDCRENIPIPKLKTVLDDAWFGRLQDPNHQRSYWLEKAANIAVFDNSLDLTHSLQAQGFRAIQLPLDMPIKEQIVHLNKHNANIFLYQGPALPILAKIKLWVLKIVLSNKIHFYPKIIVANTPYEAIGEISKICVFTTHG